MRTTQPPTDTTPTPPPTRNQTDNRRYAIYAEHELITIVTATSFYPPAAQTGPNGNTQPMALRKPRNQPKPRPRRRRRPRGINWQAIIRAIRWGQRP